MSRALLLKRPSPFAYPGGNRGFDPSHVAASGTLLSVISLNNQANMINLLTSVKGTNVSSVKGASIDGNIGPNCNWDNAAANSSQRLDFPVSLIGNTSFTAGAIVRLSALQAVGAIILSNDDSAGWMVRAAPSSGALTVSASSSTNVTSTKCFISPGVPYFVLVSSNATATNFLLLRLDTGAIITDKGTGLTNGNTRTTACHIGCNPGGYTVSWQGLIAAAMVGNNYMSTPQLLQWAQDPWSFWYPRTLDLTMMLATSASGAAYTLSGAEGAFTISGQAAALNKALKMAGAEGAFTISGQAAAMLRAIKLGGAEGAFTISGSPATLNRGIHLGTSQGAFTINGQAAVLGHGLHLPGNEGAFVISGQSAKFPVALSMKGAEGAFTISGGGAVLTYTAAGTAGQVSHSNPFFSTPGPGMVLQ